MQNKRTTMPAIESKFIPATNFKGARIKASCQRGSITVSYPHELSGEACHVFAVDKLIAKFVKEDEKRYGTNKNPWSAPRVVGGYKNVYYHVFIA